MQLFESLGSGHLKKSSDSQTPASRKSLADVGGKNFEYGLSLNLKSNQRGSVRPQTALLAPEEPDLKTTEPTIMMFQHPKLMNQFMQKRDTNFLQSTSNHSNSFENSMQLAPRMYQEE